MILRGLIISAVLSLTTACTELQFFAANFPSYFSTKLAAGDVGFGSKNKQLLDVYVPDSGTNPAPVIIFFHGGAWEYGNKNNYRFVADAFTKLGYVVVIPDYVKYPQVKFPAWQEDGAMAVSWVHDNIKTYGGDPEKLYIVGHSAGAHIGALLSTDESYMKAANGSREWIKAFAGLAGPYNFDPAAPEYIDMFGPPERYKYMKVSNYVDGKQPPMLLLTGEDDNVVAKENATKLVSSITEKGGKVETKTYKADHIDLVATFSKSSAVDLTVAEDIDKFFKLQQQTK